MIRYNTHFLDKIQSTFFCTNDMANLAQMAKLYATYTTLLRLRRATSGCSETISSKYYVTATDLCDNLRLPQLQNEAS